MFLHTTLQEPVSLVIQSLRLLSRDTLSIDSDETSPDLPATGDGFLITHHLVFHYKGKETKRDKIKTKCAMSCSYDTRKTNTRDFLPFSRLCIWRSHLQPRSNQPCLRFTTLQRTTEWLVRRRVIGWFHMQIFRSSAHSTFHPRSASDGPCSENQYGYYLEGCSCGTWTECVYACYREFHG